MKTKSSPATESPATSEVELEPHEALAIKEGAYRQALYQAWFATALEQTKSIFTLASAGVGLSVTLIYSEHIKPPQSWAPVWLLLATVMFAICSGLCIWIFRINGRLVTHLVNERDSESENGLVGRVDAMTRILFGAGLAFLVFSAVAQIWL